VISLLVSLCVLLQGVGINTIGIPKQRWYPDYVGIGVPSERSMVTYPLMRIVDTNLDRIWGQAASMMGEDDPMAIGQVVAAISASETFLGIQNL